MLYQPELKEASLAEALASTKADILVVRSTKVTDAILEAGELSLVVRAGAGYDTIDVKSASRRGIYVSNCPGKNAVAVAELTFGLILALDRRIPDNVAELRAGRWNKKEFSKAQGLHGRTLGILGFGSIGQEVARRAQAFGMHLAIWSEIGVQLGRDGLPADLPQMVRLRPSSADTVESTVTVYESPKAVAANCDILSVHLALNDKTRGLVGAAVFERMKPGACFVNTARAEIVDYKALEHAVREKGLRVAVDVLQQGAGDADRRLRGRPRSACPASTARTTSAPRPSRRSRPSPTRPSGSSRPTSRTGRVPNVVNLAGRRRPRTSW